MIRELTDEQLIARCARGDRGAMDVLVARHHGRLLDFVYRRLRDRDKAADIAQATLIRAFEAAHCYRTKASFKTWLYTIALNMTRDELRKKITHGDSLSLDVEAERAVAEEKIGESQFSPEDEALDRMMNAALWRAVRKLPENQTTAIILRFRQQLTYDEIAEVMAVPSGTVKSWVHHGLKTLRRHLGPVKCEG